MIYTYVCGELLDRGGRDGGGGGGGGVQKRRGSSGAKAPHGGSFSWVRAEGVLYHTG